jgi:hypothetical protein
MAPADPAPGPAHQGIKLVYEILFVVPIAIRSHADGMDILVATHALNNNWLWVMELETLAWLDWAVDAHAR